jgi:hypothetical protein
MLSSFSVTAHSPGSQHNEHLGSYKSYRWAFRYSSWAVQYNSACLCILNCRVSCVIVITCLLTVSKMQLPGKCQYQLLCVLHSQTCFGSNWIISRDITISRKVKHSASVYLLGYRLDDRGIGIWFLAGRSVYFSCRKYPELGPTYRVTQCVPGAPPWD